MNQKTFNNGLKVIYDQKKGNSVVVEVMVKVGSDYEKPEERGISHFLEHMLFEGTKKRPNNLSISNEIESIGGDFNAYTTNERTCFYVKILKKHFIKAIDVLSDILQNPLFEQKSIDKEKKIVLKEIDMVYDEPSYYQWVLLQKNLFSKHPCRYPTYGNKKVIKNLTKDQVVSFFKKYYVPNNMVISIVGDVPNYLNEIEKRFIVNSSKTPKSIKTKEPKLKKSKVKKEKREIVNTYVLLGFKTVPKGHKDSYVLDVINAVLGRGQSGKMFAEIRSKRALAYEVGTQSLSETSFGYFAIFATINKKNISKVRKIILKELDELKELKKKELKDAKDFIEGNHLLSLENNQKRADQLLVWEQAGDFKLINNYLKEIKKISLKDISRVVKKYFNNYLMVVLEGN